MKALLTVLVLMALVGSALAFQCPLLIKQLSDQVVKLPPGDPKVKPAKALIEEARKLHGEGSHARSVAKADEAATLLQIELKKH